MAASILSRSLSWGWLTSDSHCQTQQAGQGGSIDSTGGVQGWIAELFCGFLTHVQMVLRQFSLYFDYVLAWTGVFVNQVGTGLSSCLRIVILDCHLAYGLELSTGQGWKCCGSHQLLVIQSEGLTWIQDKCLEFIHTMKNRWSQ